LSPRAARHIQVARTVFGEFASLLDFCRKVDRTVLTRQDLLLLIKLGAFAWTGLARGQLALAEQYYAGAAQLLRAADRDPSGTTSIETDFAEGTARFLDVEEWPPEVTAAFELAHLCFYCLATHEVQRHAKRLAEEFGVVSIAELVDYPDKAPVSVAGIVTTLRVRTTKKGEAMAWIVLSDGTAGLECAVFPSTYQKLNGPTVLREGAFLVGQGRLAREEATGHKIFLDNIVPLGGRGAHLSALAVAVEQRHSDVPPPSSLIA
jgi:DNA polymerase III subunit alpha